MRRSGFTLVEALVAVLLAALVLGAAWAMSFTGNRSVRVSERRLDAGRAAHLLFESLHRDLEAARYVGAIEGLVPDPEEAAGRGPDATDDGAPAVASVPADRPATSPRLVSATLLVVGPHTYIHVHDTGRLWVDGRRWPFARFARLRLDLLPAGRADLGIVALSEDAMHPEIRLHAQVEVPHLSGRALYPLLVEDFREAHGYCVDGDPIDY